MPRIRTVKPEFWSDEDLGSITHPARLLAVGILNYCDSEGYFKANASFIKSSIFMYDDIEPDYIISYIDELIKIGYAKIFAGADGKKYGLVINFNKHQVIKKGLKGEKESVIKNLCGSPVNGSLFSLDEYRTSTGTVQGKSAAVPGGKERKGKEQGKERKGKDILCDESHDSVGIIFEHWKKVMKHQGAKLDAPRKGKIERALEKYPEKFLLETIEGCANSTHHMGDNDQQTIYDSIDLIFRNADKIEMFHRKFLEPPYKNNLKNLPRHTQSNAELLKKLNGE